MRLYFRAVPHDLQKATLPIIKQVRVYSFSFIVFGVNNERVCELSSFILLEIHLQPRIVSLLRVIDDFLFEYLVEFIDVLLYLEQDIEADHFDLPIENGQNIVDDNQTFAHLSDEQLILLFVACSD